MKAVEGEKTKAVGEAAGEAEKVGKVEEPTAVWRKRTSSGSVASGGGGDFVSSIRRLGLMTFRMAMIMTTLRIMDDGDLKTLLVCSDTDFQTVIGMAGVIVQHMRAVYLKFFISDADSDADNGASGRWGQSPRGIAATVN